MNFNIFVEIIVNALIKNQVWMKEENKKNVENVMETKQNIVVVLKPLVFMKMIGLVSHI